MKVLQSVRILKMSVKMVKEKIVLPVATQVKKLAI